MRGNRGTSFAALVPIAVCALALLACRRCPDPPFSPLESGSFRAQVSGGARDPSFPQFGGTDKTVTIERASGTVVVRYRRGNDSIVERWKIKKLAPENH